MVLLSVLGWGLTAFAADKPAKPAGGEANQTVKWIPRRLPAPEVIFRNVLTGEEVVPDYTTHRYTVVLLVASWNALSRDVAERARDLVADFPERALQLYGLGSHDTEAALREWVRTARFRFPVGVANVDFITRLKNPKIPCLWILNHRGEMIFFRERVDVPLVERLVGNLRSWTNF